MMCKKIILFSLLLWLIQSANAQVYKCQTEGKTVYSQTPCDADVKEMHLKTQSAASSGFGLREGEIRMLEQINARENEEKRNDNSKEDRKQRLREIQAVLLMLSLISGVGEILPSSSYAATPTESPDLSALIIGEPFLKIINYEGPWQQDIFIVPEKKLLIVEQISISTIAYYQHPLRSCLEIRSCKLA